MRDPLVELEHQVAAAADAWLTDPRDVEVYRRLVATVLARREHLAARGRPVAGGAVTATAAADPGVDDAGVDDAGVGDLGVGDPGVDDPDQAAAVPSVGAFLDGDPRVVLERLRRGG